MIRGEQDISYHQAGETIGQDRGFADNGSGITGFVLGATTEALSGRIPQASAALLLEKLGARFTSAELYELVVPERTLARRLARKELLTPAETDRALRVARISAEADRVFGDPEKAGRWLRRANSSLGGQTPIGLMRSEAGAQIVEEALGQIDHGMFA